MKKRTVTIIITCLFVGIFAVSGLIHNASATPPSPLVYEAFPPFMAASVPPLVMLVMGRDHKLYYEAYNDASDLDGDGTLDISYKPGDIDYYGYFDCYKYYEYSSTNDRFEPVGITADKKAPSGYWSGDFLNYLTMSRMDALRKVLYGGYRSTDTATETVLERAYIPQDAHSWGKEYESISNDGYDIREYADLGLPATGTRHLFASTSLYDASDSSYAPLLRVLPNNIHRIWDWVAKERPVCDNSLETGVGNTWEIVPGSTGSGISNVTQTCYSTAGNAAGSPNNHTEFDTLKATYAISPSQGSSAVTTINGNGNPFSGDDNYLTIFTGTLNIATAGTYNFAVDGDDAVEFIVDGGDNVLDGVDDIVVASWYGGHGRCNCQDHDGTITLAPGAYLFEFRHQENTGGDNYYLWWELSSTSSTITDYTVRVEVADSSMPEVNCKTYPSGALKPVGLLQRHGESDGMYFGLLSGSYTKNTSGGVLRKNVGTITDEIDLNTGQFTSVNGIINTIDTFRVVDFRYSDHAYQTNCGWITTTAISEGQCRMWGNPVGEMMYETLRYFSGAATPTSAFTYSDANDNTPNSGTQLSLPKPAWNDPYDTSANGFDYCSKPFMLVLSDINPSFDSDQLPGSYFGSMSTETIGNAGSAMDVDALSDTISTAEGVTGNKFIGQQGTTTDGACTEKNVTGFGQTRGLCPEEPTKQGSYSSAAVAYYGRKEDIYDNSMTEEPTQNVRTYTVGLASPLPKIEITLSGQTVTLVPFAKSVGGASIDPARGNFQPTNTIVDFFIEELLPQYGRFRINYEDVEQGADHDMDAIITYTYQLVDSGGIPVDEAHVGDAVAIDITLSSDYAAGGIIQHCGYIISGTTTDGTYLEVRDVDTAAGSDPDYFLDTPPNIGPNQGVSDTAWDDNVALPLSATRSFTVSGTGGTLAAGLLKNPLWYAAKWGGFEDSDGDDTPNLQEEWDKDNDGSPDTYFYVVNPLKLEEQLNKSFADILEKAASGTAASVLATNSEGEGNLVQAYFKPKLTTLSDDMTWLGYIQSLWVDSCGNLREDSNQNQRLDYKNPTDSSFASAAVDQIITYFTDTNGETKIRRYGAHYMYNPLNSTNCDCVLGNLSTPLPCTEAYYEIALNEIVPIFEAGSLLADQSADNRNIFTFIDGNGLDDDSDTDIDESGEDEGSGLKYVGRVLDPSGDDPFDDSNEIIRFHIANYSSIKPFLGVKDNADWSYLDATPASPDHDSRVRNLIEFIRGKDDGDLTGSVNTRNRTNDDGKVWKLGDIVNSTPMSISKPPENYHIIYGDESYQTYYNWAKDRETVVYAGGNDGMLHAFTSWIYDSSAGQYTQKSGTSEAIGDEIWAYVPQTLLPHLKWLADPDYAHSFYVDQRPKVFDAKIIDDGTHYNDGDSADDWGTILLVGLNMGGKHCWAEGDFDSSSATADVTRHFYPTYICMDISDPRNPRLLWERSYEDLGMSRSTPAVVKIKTSATDPHGQWFVVFGSGPNDSTGISDYDGLSDQNGYIFVVDLKTGALSRKFDTGESNAFMNAPVSFDKDLDYNVDAIYCGSASKSGSSPWSGKAYVLNTHDNSGTPSTDITNHWTFTTFFDAQKPITAPFGLSVDESDNVWAYFGTGRYMGNSDKLDEEQQYLFGIKDPYFNTGPKNASSPLGLSDIFDATPYNIYTNGLVTSSGGLARINSWDALINAVRNTENQGSFPDVFDGWYRELTITTNAPSERVISKPGVLGGIIFCPAYTPNDDICGYGGDTSFYGLYYETGTAYYKSVLPGNLETVSGETYLKANPMINIGHGVPPPSIGFHVGRQQGAKAYLQMSTGEVVELDVDTAFNRKSGLTSWRQQ